MKDEKTNFSLINRLPDDDTMEIVLYGTAYADVKAALFRLDRLDDILKRRMSDNLATLKILDPEKVSEVIEDIDSDPELRYRKEDPRGDVLAKVQRHLSLISAVRWCAGKRSMVRMYGRLIGAQEQGEKIRASDEQIRTWRNAVLQVAKEPMEYATVRDGYD